MKAGFVLSYILWDLWIFWKTILHSMMHHRRCIPLDIYHWHQSNGMNFFVLFVQLNILINGRLTSWIKLVDDRSSIEFWSIERIPLFTLIAHIGSSWFGQMDSIFPSWKPKSMEYCSSVTCCSLNELLPCVWLATEFWSSSNTFFNYWGKRQYEN